MKTLACCLALLLTQQGQVPYIETLEVRVHSIDVVVTDAQGRPVRDLKREDFEILQDGVIQPITNFSSFAEEVRTRAPGAETPSAAAEATESRPPRKFIFYVDEMSLVQPTQKKLLGEVMALVDQTLEPGDEAMVVRPAQATKLATAFTSDLPVIRNALTTAISQEKWRAVTPIFRERHQLEIELRNAGSSPRARRIAMRRWAGFVRKRVQQRLGQLQALVNGAAEMEGRKVLVLITESLPLEPGKEAFLGDWESDVAEAGQAGSAFGDWNVSDIAAVDWVDLTPLLSEIARNAATNGITIYALQAEYGLGLFVPGGDIGATTPGREALGDPFATAASQRPNASVSRVQTAIPTEAVWAMIDNTTNSLRTLADKTGGKAFIGGGRIDDLVDVITSDIGTYYSLGYRAGEQVDVAHKIAVRVKGRPELRVRTRQEVIRKSPEREMTDRVVAALLEEKPRPNELPIRIESKLVGVAADRSHKTYYVAARVPLEALTFLPDGDKYKATFSVHYAVMGADADFVSGVAGTQVLDIPAAEFESAKKTHFTYVVPVNLRPAKHTIAIGVLDSISHLSGFGRTEIVVR